MAKLKIEAPKRGLKAMHPGELLREEVLPALKAEGISKVAVAEALHISRQTLEDIVKERKPVTPQMALRLAKYFGNKAEFWLKMQGEWDLERAAREIAPDLATIQPYQLAA